MPNTIENSWALPRADECISSGCDTEPSGPWSEMAASAPCRVAEQCISCLLRREYAMPDEVSLEKAESGLRQLERCPFPCRCTKEWEKAMAVCLLAQGRQSDAGKYFAALENNDTASDQFLAAARFGWPSSLPRPTYPKDKAILSQAVIGAVSRGDLEMLEELSWRGAQLDMRVCRSTATMVAAAAGRVAVLKFLASKNICLCPKTLDIMRPMIAAMLTPLYCAAEHGRIEAATYLLDIGGVVAWDRFGSPAMVAAETGHIDVLRLFLERAPVPVKVVDNSLLVVQYIRPLANEVHLLVDLLRFFVKDAGININAAIHWLAGHGTVDVTQVEAALRPDW